MKKKRYHPNNWWNGLSYNEKNKIRREYFMMELIKMKYWWCDPEKVKQFKKQKTM